MSEIVAARLGIEPRTSCSASQELNYYTTTAPDPVGDQSEWNIQSMI